MKSLYALLFLVGILKANVVYSQQSQASAGIDLGSGFTSNSWAPSILYHEELSIPKLPWLRIGLGIRGWGYYSERINLFTRKGTPKDFLEYRDVSANGVSFVLGANIRVWRIDLGVNTDLAGVSLGTKRHAYYDKRPEIPGTGAANYETWVATRPVIFNAVPLLLNNYNGQSEVYARIFFSRSIGLKVGYVYGQIAYLTKNSRDGRVFLDNSQRRVYNTYGMPYAALTIPLFN